MNDLKAFLDEQAIFFNSPEFIKSDPIQVPHRFSLKEDIEIAGFLTSVIAWGNRNSIINSASRIMERMDSAPYDFVMNHRDKDLEKFEGSVHRTFNTSDLMTFIKSLQLIYKEHGGLEGLISLHQAASSLQPAIHELKKVFFSLPHLERTRKHLPDPLNGSAAKRINMFLRWMVRKDNAGVDFGLWNSVSPAKLSCPLDVHSGNVARKLGLLTRKQNDATAVEELDLKLREMDPEDPVKYDFALFGLGVTGSLLK